MKTKQHYTTVLHNNQPMKQILKQTGLTVKQYEGECFNVYLKLLSELSNTENHLQLLIINQPINKWFLMEVKKVNEKFIADTVLYPTSEKEVVLETYRSYLNGIGRNYPSALLKQVKVKKLTTLFSYRCN